MALIRMVMIVAMVGMGTTMVKVVNDNGTNGDGNGNNCNKSDDDNGINGVGSGNNGNEMVRMMMEIAMTKLVIKEDDKYDKVT